MCDEYRERPLGFTEAESVWYTHNAVVREAMNNDPYTNGGVIDSTNKYGYVSNQPFGVGAGKTILEKYFSYEELRFLSCFRLQTATLPEVKRFKELISRFEKYLSENALETTMGNTVPGYTPSYNGWNNPNLGTSVQPLYGAPAPMSIPPEWRGETPCDLSRRQMGSKEWNDYFASLNNDDVQKGPNEPDEKEEEMPSFLGSVWDNKPSPVRSSLREAPVIPGAPEPGFKNRTPKSTTRVVLSAEGASSKDDVQKGPNEPGESKDRFSLKGILDYPSTGVEINENPVPLTEENKSVDKDNEKD
jgi:hypothetical protein